MKKWRKFKTEIGKEGDSCQIASFSVSPAENEAGAAQSQPETVLIRDQQETDKALQPNRRGQAEVAWHEAAESNLLTSRPSC